MLRVSFQRVKPNKEAQLRAWLAELSTRAEEVRATFVEETVRHEQAFILQTNFFILNRAAPQIGHFLA